MAYPSFARSFRGLPSSSSRTQSAHDYCTNERRAAYHGPDRRRRSSNITKDRARQHDCRSTLSLDSQHADNVRDRLDPALRLDAGSVAEPV